MKRKRTGSLFIVYCLLLIATGCTYNNKEEVKPKPCLLPDILSFQKDIIPIFKTHCSLSGCHSGSQPTGHLNLEAQNAYSQLFKQQEIDTVHPTYSSIYIKMNSASNPMPPTGKLDNCTVSTVLKWIQQGGKNN